jgi:hypothetical protein
MRLGFEHLTGHVYEGTGAAQFAVWPPPLLSQAKLIESPEDWRSPPRGVHADPFAWVFREDRFDPVTRVRRGRLFQSDGAAQPNSVRTAGHPLTENAVASIAGSGRTRTMYTYMPCQEIINRPDGGLGAVLLVGQDRGATAWRVIQAEIALDGDVVVTLKAKSAFGVLPEMAWDNVPENDRPLVRAALERVLDSAFRETPVSVIDQCRNAAAVVVSRWLVSNGRPEAASKDLAEVAKLLEAKPQEKHCASWLGQVIARLHVRGKSNEQAAKGLRLPTEDDAELCLHSLGFLLREIGWAVP